MTVKMEKQFPCLPSYLHFHAEWHSTHKKMRNLGSGGKIFYIIIVHLNFEFLS